MEAWLFLAAAIALEVAGTTSLKLSAGFTKPLFAVLVIVCYLGAFVGLGFALKKIDVSVAYAIWAGVGTAIVALIGYVYFHENMSLLKFLSLTLIILGVVGLNLGGSQH